MAQPLGYSKSSQDWFHLDTKVWFSLVLFESLEMWLCLELLLLRWWLFLLLLLRWLFVLCVGLRYSLYFVLKLFGEVEDLISAGIAFQVFTPE